MAYITSGAFVPKTRSSTTTLVPLTSKRRLSAIPSVTILKRRRSVQHQLTIQMQQYEYEQNDDMNNIPDESNGVYPSNGKSPSIEEENEASDQVVDAQVRGVPLNELKCELYATLSSVNRGFTMTNELREQIEELTTQIENEKLDEIDISNRQKTLINGNWRLIYTTALDVLSLGLLSPLSISVNQIYQPIEYNESENVYDVQNIIEIEPIISTVLSGMNRTLSTLIVGAKASVKDDKKSLSLTFESVQAKPVSFFGFQIPDQIKSLITPPKIPIGSPVGSFETTFLDEDIRISRVRLSNNTSTFIFIREP